MTLKTVSYNSLILHFEDVISQEILNLVRDNYQKLKTLSHISNLTPSYNSILIEYDINYYNYNSIKETILKHLEQSTTNHLQTKSKLIEVEVDYSKGIDLQRVSDLNHISKEEVIKIHSQTIYRVYAIGFLVGFAYLAKVDKKIATPRLTTPRSKVPKGSVAIADTQTAIYPQESAGGWNIIGLTNFNAFESFEVGDMVRFISV